ncbi:hypothetical protein BSL78_14065 [Apostichopus japonicus]|uniref:Thyroglobulin type-1 domain-containing protein n=1 Tax=Stichopus japonicus TaxID=307972 RepID=A0A2G8KM72_STIJA|nr:hypothetical protein BSL78_14065 [Apostichopus japonicus]
MFRFAAVAVCIFVISEVSAQTCLVSDISLQNDFSPQKYVGTWYIVAHIQDGVYPYQRRSHYHLNSDMTFSMATQRIVEPAGCEEPWHFEVTGWSPDATQPAKMLVRPNIENLEVEPECDAQLGVPGLSSEKRYPNCITHLEEIMIEDAISDDSFIPRCEEGGVLYRPLQCAVDGMVCWCVEEESGKELPNTRTRLPESPPC